MSKNKINILTGTSIVVANMIGAGVFTSLGFQLVSLHNTATILTLWLCGGVIALSGAFSYAEIGTLIKKSGGEFTFLSRIYHPVVGYLSGWISLTVGFAAPIALSAFAFADYLPIRLMPPVWTAISVILLITSIHTFNLRYSARFQNISTVFKVLLILAIIIVGLYLPANKDNALLFNTDYLWECSSSAFAVSLIYVSYSYSGWNAATYITEEFKHPRKAIPRSLIYGTCIVTTLYTLLQFVFLKHTPLHELVGQLDIATPGIRLMLGEQAATCFGWGFSALLISGISAMIWIGPRVTASIAREYPLWRFFKARDNDVPRRALWLQFAISTTLLLSGTFEQIMIYCGVLLSISTLLVVLGVILVRYKKKAHPDNTENFKSPAFPLFQIIFIAASLWMIAFAFLNHTKECMLGLINLLIGYLTYRRNLK